MRTSSSNPRELDGLVKHHSQCEMNYHRCLALVPNCRDGESQWALTLEGKERSNVLIKLLDSAPYTTTVEISQDFNATDYLQPHRLKVRLYHDVEMAEVIGWDRHRHWQPVYDYPNKNMYQPDEKMVLNRFLGELLFHCRKLGIVDRAVCESIRITKN